MYRLFIFLSIFPLIAQASSSAEGGVPWSLITSQAVNFFILIFLAKIFLKKPLVAGVKNQRASFLKEEDRAGKSAKEATALLQTWQKKWADLSKTFSKKLDVAKTDSVQKSEESLVVAEQNALSIVKKAKDQVQTTLAQAKAELAELLLQESCNGALENQKAQSGAGSINLSLLNRVNNNGIVNEKN